MNNDQKQAIIDYAKRTGISDPGQIQHNLHHRLRIGRGDIRAALNGHTEPAKTTTTVTPVNKRRTLSAFKREHDYAGKIAAAVKRHLAGETYMTEAEFRAVSGVPPQHFRRYAELPQFDDNRIKVDGVVNWGSVETVAAMREILGAI